MTLPRLGFAVAGELLMMEMKVMGRIYLLLHLTLSDFREMETRFREMLCTDSSDRLMKAVLAV